MKIIPCLHQLRVSCVVREQTTCSSSRSYLCAQCASLLVVEVGEVAAAVYRPPTIGEVYIEVADQRECVMYWQMVMME